MSGVDYASLAAAEEAGAPVIKYGIFLNKVLDFLIVAFVIFLVVRQMNRLKRKEEAPPAEPTTKGCDFCKTDIPIGAVRCPHCTSELKAA
jgi:large conductance mechanosensitive channel